MAGIKQIYSHSPASEERWYERHITVEDGGFGRVIALVYRSPGQDSALENAQMIVKALHLDQIVGASLKCPRCGLGELERLRILEELDE